MTEYFNSNHDGCRVCVLYGLGGAGKTQVGLRFVLLCQKSRRFTDVFFLDASNIDTLHTDFKTIARANSAGSTVEDVQHYLSSRQDEWLLFFDNADDPSLDLGPFLSWSHGNVLITTRNVSMRAHAPDCHIRIHSLTMEESVALLMRGIDIGMDERTRSAAAEIVEELGFLPLTITHARAYLEHGSCDLEGYLELYRIDHQSLLQERPVQSTDNYEYSVYSTWMLSFKRLSEHAVVFLQLLCFMHHEGIPLRIVEMAYQNFVKQNNYYEDCVPQSVRDLFAHLRGGGTDWSPYRYRSLLNEILSLSLIQSDVVNRTLSFHPLVQKLLRSLFEANRQLITASQSFLSLALPTGESTDDHACRRTLVVQLRGTVEYGINIHPNLLYPFGRAYHDAGKYADACRICELDVKLRQELYGLEHPDTLQSMSSLAVSYRALGRAAEALPLCKQVLELRKRLLGSDHPDTLHSMNNLTSSYMALGRAKEALPLNKQSLTFSHPFHHVVLKTLTPAFSQDRDSV
ncbi:P-loop containing nucleoside triphosphate hydrolase protein, partial [Flagelloscypha sp. PMI_526]